MWDQCVFHETANKIQNNPMAQILGQRLGGGLGGVIDLVDRRKDVGRLGWMILGAISSSEVGTLWNRNDPEASRTGVASERTIILIFILRLPTRWLVMKRNVSQTLLK